LKLPPLRLPMQRAKDKGISELGSQPMKLIESETFNKWLSEASLEVLRT